MTRDELIRYVAERFSTEPEYPWDDDSFIFRHQGNRKWFAVAMLMDSYRMQPGILPGYHMNKDHWVTILLDGSAEEPLIRELFEISYDLTNSKRKAKRKE